MKKFIRYALIFVYQAGLRFFGGLGLQKIWPLGMIRDWLSDMVRNFDRGESVLYRGHKIFLDKEDSLELSVWGEEHMSSRELKVIEEVLKKGDTVIDVGANIGLFALSFAQAVGEEGQVFAFEPAPDNLALLQKNIEANHYKNITVIPKAVTEKEETLTLYLSDFNPGDHRIYNPEEKIKDWDKSSAVYDKLKSGVRNEVQVTTVALDHYFKDYQKPVRFIKIDVQGAEGAVLQGMKGLLQKNHEVVIYTEFWPAGLKMFGLEAREFLTTLETLGFSFYETEGYKEKKSVSKDALLQKYTVENNLSGDIFCARS